MRLYVCFDFMKNIRTTGRPGGHPCGNALHALREAGYDPDITAVGGLGLPLLNRTAGRGKVEELTGRRTVPVLVPDGGEPIHDSKQIIAWAKAHPATG
jgi:hypothetical protein